MTTSQRNFLATLCLQHVKFNEPSSFALLKQLAEDNIKPNSPRFSAGYVYFKFQERIKKVNL